MPLPGNMGKKIPKPFSRPSISIGEKKVVRDWQHVSALNLSPGDILPDHGVILNVARYEFTVSLIVGDPEPHSVSFSTEDTVFAFTSKD